VFRDLLLGGAAEQWGIVVHPLAFNYDSVVTHPHKGGKARATPLKA
jgi:hypothetical protein